MNNKMWMHAKIYQKWTGCLFNCDIYSDYFTNFVSIYNMDKQMGHSEYVLHPAEN